MKISTIIFDMGKVLVDFNLSKALQSASLRSALDVDEIAEAVFKEPLLKDFEKGKVSTEAFFEHIKNLIQYEDTADELCQIWSEIFTPIEPHIQLARQLQPHYQLALLSNTILPHIEYIESHYNFLEIFNPQNRFYSYELGLLKPEPEIYTTVLEKLGADKYETLFIDDLEANVLVPSKMGWQTIHLRPDVSLELALQSYELNGL